jgi:hypothetical protein
LSLSCEVDGVRPMSTSRPPPRTQPRSASSSAAFQNEPCSGNAMTSVSIPLFASAS